MTGTKFNGANALVQFWFHSAADRPSSLTDFSCSDLTGTFFAEAVVAGVSEEDQFAERSIRSCRHELRDHVISLNEGSKRDHRALTALPFAWILRLASKRMQRQMTTEAVKMIPITLMKPCFRNTVDAMKVKPM